MQLNSKLTIPHCCKNINCFQSTVSLLFMLHCIYMYIAYTAYICTLKEKYEVFFML